MGRTDVYMLYYVSFTPRLSDLDLISRLTQWLIRLILCLLTQYHSGTLFPYLFFLLFFPPPSILLILNIPKLPLGCLFYS